MKPTKNFLDWEKVFLDTCVIIDFMRGDVKDEKLQERIAFCRKLLSFLASNPTPQGEQRQFYISAVTLTEIRQVGTNGDISNKIIEALPGDSLMWSLLTAVWPEGSIRQLESASIRIS